jgi:putative addiction module component (TIGR02574 family)
MTEQQIEELHKLSREEKIQLAQMLWEDVANEQDNDNLPEDHKEILEERLSRINKGEAKFRSWEDVRRKYEAK